MNEDLEYVKRYLKRYFNSFNIVSIKEIKNNNKNNKYYSVMFKTDFFFDNPEQKISMISNNYVVFNKINNKIILLNKKEGENLLRNNFNFSQGKTIKKNNGFKL